MNPSPLCARRTPDNQCAWARDLSLISSPSSLPVLARPHCRWAPEQGRRLLHVFPRCSLPAAYPLFPRASCVTLLFP